MSRRGFSTDADYVQSVQGLHRLHALSAAGNDDEPEADAVRASLEHPWVRLSEAERRRIAGLSEDLYTISEPAPAALPMNPEAQRKLVEAFEARRAGQWDEALELLRRWGRQVDPALVSYLRGSVWMDAGDYATAALFLRHAAQLEPANENYASLYLLALSRSDLRAAVARAEEVLGRDQAHAPSLVVRAAEIRLLSTRGMSDVDARPVFQELVGVLDRTLARLLSHEGRQPTAHDSSYTLATALAAFCHEHLGDAQAALRSCNLGIAADPDNDGLLVARGMLQYGADRSAVNDFEHAVRYGSPVVWPYFFLAHHYLVSNRFEECRSMSEQALRMPASDVVRANLYEWLAIARAELGFPPQQVRAAFEEAIRSEPGDERIRRNLRAFEESVARQAAQPRAWDKPAESLVQAVGQAEFQPAHAVSRVRRLAASARENCAPSVPG